MIVECPFCCKKQTQKPTKTWKYLKTVTVNQYACECGKPFRFYKSPKNTWTIPKKK